MIRRVIVSAPTASGGLYAHLRNVLPRLLELCPEWRFEVHAPEGTLRAVFDCSEEPWMFSRPDGGRAARLRWEFVDLPRLLRADREALLLAPFGPLLNLQLSRRAVVRLDNLIVLLDRSERVLSPEDEWRIRILRHVYLANARRALRPVLASVHSRARYVALTGLPEDRFAVVPHGIDPAAVAGATPTPAIEALCRRRPFLLHIGQATPYRFTRELIRAHRLLVERDPRDTPPLVWAGAARRQDREYEAECLELLEPLVREDRAIHLGQIGHQDVYALGRATRLFLHPSVHEDCPNTILEALAAGAPVICADIAANREFGGDAVHFLDEPSVPAIASAIQTLLADARLRESLAERGRARARAWSWDATALGMASTLEEAFASRGRLSARDGRQRTSVAARIVPRSDR